NARTQVLNSRGGLPYVPRSLSSLCHHIFQYLYLDLGRKQVKPKWSVADVYWHRLLTPATPPAAQRPCFGVPGQGRCALCGVQQLDRSIPASIQNAYHCTVGGMVFVALSPTAVLYGWRRWWRFRCSQQ